MTATDRELLAHAIWTTGRTRAVDRFPLADALMPVVEAIAEKRARRRVAEELGEALSVSTTRGPLDGVAWMARRHAALTDHKDADEETL